MNLLRPHGAMLGVRSSASSNNVVSEPSILAFPYPIWSAHFHPSRSRLDTINNGWMNSIEQCFDQFPAFRPIALACMPIAEIPRRMHGSCRHGARGRNASPNFDTCVRIPFCGENVGLRNRPIDPFFALIFHLECPYQGIAGFVTLSIQPRCFGRAES